MDTKIKEEAATLEILQVVENKSDVTQRHLAERLDIALGLANSYLKRCVRKGLVKVQQAPANRYLYYLTPKGFTEKSRLTASYLNHSFNFYRNASESLTSIFHACEEAELNKVLLFGASELAEIASIRVQEHSGLEVVGVCEPLAEQQQYFNYPLWKGLDSATDFDVCILTALDQALPYYELLLENLDGDRLMVPSILGIKH